MNVIKPNNSTHTIKVIPRTTDTSNLSLVFYNEDTRETLASITPTIAFDTETLNLTFDLDVVEGNVYSYKVLNSTDTIIYRGKVFVTQQTTQKYKING